MKQQAHFRIRLRSDFISITISFEGNDPSSSSEKFCRFIAVNETSYCFFSLAEDLHQAFFSRRRKNAFDSIKSRFSHLPTNELSSPFSSKKRNLQ